MPIDCAVLMCHAPIVIPAVGGERGRACLSTTNAMKMAATALVDAQPDVLVILSPHTPRAKTAWAIPQGPRLQGDMSRFGAPESTVDLPFGAAAAEQIHQAAAQAGLTTWRTRTEALDHGAAVPLYFAQQAGWKGETVLLALPWEAQAQEVTMGNALAAAAEKAGQRWAILASGDMSHRLKPGAPAGFHPEASQFDERFVAIVTSGDYQALRKIAPDLRELAAEDCVQTTLIAAAAGQWRTEGARLLHYEGPFGVGYSEAILFTARGQHEA
jgi:MEMO1 family protein